MKKNHIYLFILIICYLIIRLAILCLGTKEIYGGDELCYGAIARELIGGPVLPFFDYQPSKQNGAWCVMPFLITPFFIVFGPSYFSLKLASLLFPLATIILLYLFLDEFFNQRVAVLTSLLLILSPPSYTRFSFMALGSHIESSLFSVAAVYIFYKIFFCGDQKICSNYVSKSYFVLFGLIGGFGSFFCYTFIISLIVLLIIWFIINRNFFLTKDFLLFIFFFLLGFSPWLYNNIFNLHFGGFDLLKEAFLKSSYDIINIPHFFHRIILLPYFIVGSMYFKSVGLISKDSLAYVYFFIFVTSYLTLAWRSRFVIAQFFHGIFSFKKDQINLTHSARVIFFLAYPLIFLFIFAFSNFSLSKYRYFMPIYPFMFIIISLFIDALVKRNKYFAGLIVVILILTGVTGNISLLSCNSFKRISQYKGFRYHFLGYPLVKRYRFNLGRYISSIEKLDKLARRDVYRKIAIEISGGLKEEDIEKWLDYVNKINHSYRLYFYNELGASIQNLFGQDIDKAVYLIDRVEPEYKFFIYKGLVQMLVEKFAGDFDKCSGFLYSLNPCYKSITAHLWYTIICGKFSEMNFFPEDIKRFVKLSERVPLADRPYIYKELGKSIGDNLLDDFSTKLKNLDMDRIFAIASLLPEEYRSYLYEGFGEGIIENYNEFLALDLADQVCPGYRGYVYRGIGKGFTWIYGEDIDIVLKRIDAQLDIKYRPFLYEGIRLIN